MERDLRRLWALDMGGDGERVEGVEESMVVDWVDDGWIYAGE